ncbi:branched-chain amino acid transport system substrate-binding protein [Desulfobaculum xiamenense]|uniref:Branched-chain amino acid transport system substrate-binding protein n=1 Tax=Desulfobaculum xiamenense TaxID=995050 RepID=A0A846QK10_9BACT|nr:ABC transporter substrate-binding protein [Desulfobaculum xiamenense]NJB66513.1 branched-chain amino acid transport system substrate-binding protein [Desulfobaculum xiamenense]
MDGCILSWWRVACRLCLAVVIWWCAGCGSALAGPDVVRIHMDADWTGVRESSESIERGLMTAIAASGGTLGGVPVEIIRADHRGNSRRSLENLKAFLADDRALAVVTGLHSPPLLANRDFINANGILTLVPWAAASSITRHPSRDNWIFRVSVDDAKAGMVMVAHAVDVRGFRRPALLLEQTGWGHSNEAVMVEALAKRGVRPAGTYWFNWGISESAARLLLREVRSGLADCILFVGNAPEGKAFMLSMASLGPLERLPVLSHWGLTGGDFHKAVGPEIRRDLDLSFLQTRFSFVSDPDDSVGRAVLALARRLYPDVITTGADIAAPAGFIHAYDMGLLLAAAVRTAGGLTDDIRADRARIRDALEHLPVPVEGLVKTYVRPFRPFSETDPDAHDALGYDELVMARYAEDGTIVLLPR